MNLLSLPGEFQAAANACGRLVGSGQRQHRMGSNRVPVRHSGLSYRRGAGIFGDVRMARPASNLSLSASRQGSSAISRQGSTRIPGTDGGQTMINTMTYRGYVASMSFDAEDRIIVGRVLDIDDIISFHGESVSEFEENFHVVVDDYIAACESLGSTPEKPASGRLMLRVDPGVHAAALKAAARSGTSLNKWAEQALRRASRKTSTARG